MRVRPAFLVESDNGVALRTFTVEADAHCWLNQLSAVVARKQRDADGELTERRQTMTKAAYTAKAKTNAWSYAWRHRGAGLRKTER